MLISYYLDKGGVTEIVKTGLLELCSFEVEQRPEDPVEYLKTYVEASFLRKENEDLKKRIQQLEATIAPQGPANSAGAPPKVAWVEVEDHNSGTEALLRRMKAFPAGGNTYVGRACHDGACHVGGVSPSTNTCKISVAGWEHKANRFFFTIL